MPYLGNDLQVAQPSYRNIDDISSSFNSVTTSFALLVGGFAPVPFPINSNQCLISVAGVVQRPDDSGAEGFRLSGGNIIFSSAPTTGSDFFGVILAGADYVNVGANFPSGSAAVPSITFDSDLDTGIYNSAPNQVSITTSGTERLRVDSSGQIESVSLGSASSPAYSWTADPNTGIYSPGADQVAVATNGTGRLFVDSSGNVSIGSSSFGTYSDRAISLYSTTNPSIKLSNSTTGSTLTDGIEVILSGSDGYLWNRENASWIFGTNNVERMRLTSTGLGVGTSSPSGLFDARGFSYLSGAQIRDSSHVAKGYVQGDARGFLLATDGSTNIAFDVNGTERMRLDTSGRLGVGTTAPAAALHVVGTTEDQIRIGTDPAIHYRIGRNSSSGLCTFYGSQTGFTGYVFSGIDGERARIDSSGRLLVGTSTARAAGGHTGRFQLEGTNYEEATASIAYNANDANGGYLHFIKTRTGNTVVQNGDLLGHIRFYGTDGSAPVAGVSIKAEVDGTPGANDMPGRLVLSTTADGASSPTERMRITSAGLVGIGTSSPETNLDVRFATSPGTDNGGGYNALRSFTTSALAINTGGALSLGGVYHSNGAVAAFGQIAGRKENATSNDLSGYLQFATNTGGGTMVERVRIDAAGRVGIGTTATGAGRLTVQAVDDTATGGISLRGFNDGAGNGDRTVFIDALSQNANYRANINYSSWQHIFTTNNTERARIDSSGRLLVGTSTATQGGASNFSVILADFTSQFGLALCSTQAAGTANYAQFVYNGTINGSISSNGTTTTYAITSDYRLKENVIPVFDGIARFKRLKPSRFNFIGHPESTIDGFIAHEVQQVVPEAVVGEKNATNEDGTIKPQGIDQSKLVPLLTAALQEAIAKIETLEARLTSAGI